MDRGEEGRPGLGGGPVHPLPLGIQTENQTEGSRLPSVFGCVSTIGPPAVASFLTLPDLLSWYLVVQVGHLFKRNAIAAVNVHLIASILLGLNAVAQLAFHPGHANCRDGRLAALHVSQHCVHQRLRSYWSLCRHCCFATPIVSALRG